MRVKLGSLKKGDEFYYILFDDIKKAKYIGTSHNLSYRMPSSEFVLLEYNNGSTLNDFACTDVYTDLKEAQEALKEKIENELKISKIKLVYLTQQITEIESYIKRLELKLKGES